MRKWTIEFLLFPSLTSTANFGDEGNKQNCWEVHLQKAISYPQPNPSNYCHFYTHFFILNLSICCYFHYFGKYLSSSSALKHINNFNFLSSLSHPFLSSLSSYVPPHLFFCVFLQIQNKRVLRNKLFSSTNILICFGKEFML
jgi:hypothetical protein